MTALEGRVAIICSASGQSAFFYAMLNILEVDDHFISSSAAK
jgi:O-acetylhomoserine sulfhydrylase